MSTCVAFVAVIDTGTVGALRLRRVVRPGPCRGLNP